MEAGKKNVSIKKLMIDAVLEAQNNSKVDLWEASKTGDVDEAIRKIIEEELDAALSVLGNPENWNQDMTDIFRDALMWANKREQRAFMYIFNYVKNQKDI